MFLIKYTRTTFINAESIAWIGLDDGRVQFTMLGEPETYLTVDKGLECTFLNHVQCLNSNIQNIETEYRALIETLDF